MTRMIDIPRPARIPRLGDHNVGAVHLYVEPTLPGNLATPILEPHAWDDAEAELNRSLASHGEDPHVGNRFLVGRLIRQMNLPDQQNLTTVYYDHVMTRQEDHWTRQLVAWSNETPYDYDFDVFDMRPISQCVGLQ